MKKKIIWATALASAAIPLGATVSCSLLKTTGGGGVYGKSDYTFWNYEDYIQEDAANEIGDIYQYTTFGDLPELKTALLEKKIVGGVGSDYYNADLADQGLITKIDFSALFGISADRSLWETELKKLYTPETWTLLTSFPLFKKNVKGEYLNDDGDVVATSADATNDLDGDGAQDFLWEYTVPYFMQNKVVVVNADRAKETPSNAAFLKTLKSDDQVAIEALFADKTYKGILDTLKANGFSGLTINDYMRDNMMIGSEKTGFTGNVKSTAEGKKHLDGFKEVIKGWNVNHWYTSGTDSLGSLIDPDDQQSSVSMLYNGDALYAYYGGDIDGDSGEHIRIITPQNPIFLMDGLIVPTYLENNYFELDRFYITMKNTLYSGIKTSSNYPGYIGKFNKVFRNYDYVNYTPAFKELHDYMENSYFLNDDGTTDEIAKTIGMSTRNNASKIDSDHITIALNPSDFSEISSYYEGIK